ncbi:MAG: superoxide dismutase, partial [Caulobacter sp.]|nr:superoxide dismutase [Caulobacter sp.]
MPFILPDLPYGREALEPTVSGRTLDFHHGKHHKTYVDTLNKLLEDKGESPESLEAVVKAAGPGKLFNNAAQAWNHGFFWESMTPSPAAPSGDLAQAIEAFGGLEVLKAKFVETGVGQFGSGWAWLVWKDGALGVVPSHDADTPIAHEGGANGSGFPLLVCDVWEHAYYLDHQNNRKGFLEAWFDTLANWEFAGRQLAAAQGSGEGYRYPPP